MSEPAPRAAALTLIATLLVAPIGGCFAAFDDSESSSRARPGPDAGGHPRPDGAATGDVGVALRLDEVRPPRGTARGGVELRIAGAGFAPGATLWLGSQRVVDTQHLSSELLSATTPATLAGPFDVVVRNPDGSQALLGAGYRADPLQLRFVQAAEHYLPALVDLPIADAACADLDGDGDVDLLVATSDGEHRLLLNSGHGLLSAAEGAASAPSEPVAADGGVDGGSVAGSDAGGPAQGTDAGVASPVPLLSDWRDDTRALVVTDLTADGAVDVFACTGPSAPNRLFISRGGLTFEEQGLGSSADAAPDCRAAALADLDGDGQPELLTLNATPEPGGGYAVYGWRRAALGGPAPFLPLRPAGAAGDAEPLAAGPEPPLGFVAADVDADGDEDLLLLVAAGAGETGLRLLLSEREGPAPASGSGTPGLRLTDSSAWLPELPGPIRWVAAADLNGDGASELLCVGEGQDRLLLNDGAGHFFDNTVAAMPLDRSHGRWAVLRDLDLDGVPDALIANPDAVNRLYRTLADGRMMDETPALPLQERHSLRLLPCDVDGDGDIDLVELNGAGQRARLLVSVPQPTQ